MPSPLGLAMSQNILMLCQKQDLGLDVPLLEQDTQRHTTILLFVASIVALSPKHLQKKVGCNTYWGLYWPQRDKKVFQVSLPHCCGLTMSCSRKPRNIILSSYCALLVLVTES
jgi:hypothetical protein